MFVYSTSCLTRAFLQANATTTVSSLNSLFFFSLTVTALYLALKFKSAFQHSDVGAASLTA